MKQLNTLHLSSLGLWDLKGGKGRVSTYLPLKGMVNRGYRVTFISSNKNAITENHNGILVKKIWCPFQKGRLFVKFLFHPIIDTIFLVHGIMEARKNKPDIVYAHCMHTALAAFIIAKIYKAKFVIRLYGIGKGALNKWRHFPSYMMIKRCLKIPADAYILTNDGTSADLFARKLGVPDDKIFFLKNGIQKKINLIPDEKLRNELAPHGEKIVISVSRLTNWKQVDLIIKMMPELLKQMPVRLLIIGDGDQREMLQTLAEELGVKEHVLFLGAKKQDEIYQYLNVSDAFVSMNLLSSMSNPVYEAMICGVPVVALNTGATTDLIHDGENGIILERKDMDRLPYVVGSLLQDENKRRLLGKNAQEYMYKTWPTWEERIEQEITILENL